MNGLKNWVLVALVGISIMLSLNACTSQIELQQQRLALNKLTHLPVKADSVNGYSGILVNNYQNPVQITVYGPETRSYFLDPGELTQQFLIPGEYVVRSNSSGRTCVSGMTVGSQLHYYKGTWQHFVIKYDR